MGAAPFLVVARFERKYVDANRARGDAYENPNARPYYDAYHRALREACDRVRNRWGRGLLLDLHGQGFEKENIFRGTANGKSVADLERRFGREAITGGKSILGQLALKGYKISPDFSADTERRYTGGYTILGYGSHRATGIDAIQLELGTTLRERRNLKRTADDLAEAVAVFAKQYLPLANGQKRGVME
jgi:N-formylglutamate amidohydrolase